MWSGRFREPLNTAFEEWQRSFPFDWRLLPQELAASAAHARMIAAAGILTDVELAEILRGGSQGKFVMRSGMASQSEAVEFSRHVSNGRTTSPPFFGLDVIANIRVFFQCAWLLRAQLRARFG